MRPALKHQISSYLIYLCRILVGATFLASGLAKSIDVWGTIFKIQEYLTVWGVTLPEPIIVTAAWSLCLTEFIVGFMLTCGIYKRTATWGAIMIMTIMLPLSIYLYIYNPIPDCGCFGDWISLSNTQTLIKNIILISLIAPIAYHQVQKRKASSNPLQAIVLIAGICYICFISAYGYFVQPMIDFRTYKNGTHPLSTEQTETDAPKYEYQRNGTTKEFDIDSLPTDTTWTFVKRIEPDISTPQPNTVDNEIIPQAIYRYTPKKTNKSVQFDPIAEESTPSELFEPPLLIISEYTPQTWHTKHAIKCSKLIEAAQQANINVVCMVGEKKHPYAITGATTTLPVYTVEKNTLKELVRGQIGIVYLSDEGKISWKRTIDTINLDQIQAQGFDQYLTPTYYTNLFFTITIFTAAIASLILMAGKSLTMISDTKNKIKPNHKPH